MKTVQIVKVKRIVGEGVDLVALVLSNGKPDVVRSPKEFINDLKGSFLIDESVNSMKHPSVTRCLRNLRGGMLEGDLKYAKAGETWTVTENSQVIKNKNAKGFGKYAVGDEKEYEKDATIVQDGFLTLELNEKAYEREENAHAYASARVSTSDAFVIPDVIEDEVIDVIINDDEGNIENDDEGVLNTKGAIKEETATEAGA